MYNTVMEVGMSILMGPVNGRAPAPTTNIGDPGPAGPMIDVGVEQDGECGGYPAPQPTRVSGECHEFI